MKWYLIRLLLLFVIVLSGCAQPRSIKLPPVTDGWRKSTALKSRYVVQKKDTLYSIAWAFGLDYRELAAINNLQAPYILHCGQRLSIALPSISGTKRINSRTKFERNISTVKPLLGWTWPASGKITYFFNEKSNGNKGIDIGGIYGQPVLACNCGKVVYSGTGIRSYGKLIIIKHNDDYLSAYAHNQDMLVEEGQEIKAGQKIATMGKSDEGRVILHFEIRRFGKPVNPLLYLPKRS